MSDIKKLKSKEVRELVDIILNDGEEHDVTAYLKNKIGLSIDETPEVVRKEAKVIVSRPEYTKTGLARQAQILKYTKFFVIASIFLGIVTTGLWFFLIKPKIYNNYITKGKKLILKTVYKDHCNKQAEAYFNKAIGYYYEKSDAYLQFAEVYKKIGNYHCAFEKLYGKLELLISAKTNNNKNFTQTKVPIKYNNIELRNIHEIWALVKKVPILRYNKNKQIVFLNNIPVKIISKGAYIISHLDNKRNEAKVLLALGKFHSLPITQFKNSLFRNNLLGIDYFNRCLTFQIDTPAFKKDKYLSHAINGIGFVYYNQKLYYKSLDYFEKILKKDPENIEAQAGAIATLLKIFKKTNDPRLIIQQHSIVKHQLKIEEKLPLHILTKLMAFYIDLPSKDKLRIDYNISPTDKISGKLLQSRIVDIMNIIFTKEEENQYGDKKYGRYYSEGYYQAGRYYRKIAKKIRMSMKQLEYSYKFNPNHFLALNERAEILMDLKDYEGAKKLLILAEEKIRPDVIARLGNEAEDETLIEADKGVILFNLGKAIYFSALKNLGSMQILFRNLELDKYKSKTDYGIKGLNSILDKADVYFQKAIDSGIQSIEKKSECFYYYGWSSYIKGNYKRALKLWIEIPKEWERKNRNVEFAKANAYYNLSIIESKDKYLKSSLGSLIYIRDYYEKIVNKIKVPSATNKFHQYYISKLSMIYNNLGAIYERLNNEKKSLNYYWKSIEMSKLISKENEIAKINIRLNLKRKNLDEKEKYPIIMDFISPKIDDYES